MRARWLLVLGLWGCAHEPFDLILRGGRVGTVSPVDVGIRGDRIVQIGNLKKEPSRRVIDVRGLTVSPGEIELVKAASLVGEGPVERLLLRGTTTAVMLGEAPSDFVANLAVLAKAAGASETEIDEAMKKGALGISAELPGEGGEPLLAAARVVARHGGLLVAMLTTDAPAPMEEAIDIGDRAGVPVLLCPTAASAQETLARAVAAARARGVEVATCSARKVLALQVFLRERGMVKEGYYADLVLSNGPSDRDRPPYVLIGGVLVIEKGRFTGARPGRRLYGPGYDAPGRGVRGALSSGSP